MADFTGVALTTFKSLVFCHWMPGYLRSLQNLLLKEAEGSEDTPNLRSLPFSEFWLKQYEFQVYQKRN